MGTRAYVVQVATRSPAAEATVDRLLARVRGPLLEIERRYRAQGRSVADAGLDEIASRMTAMVPATSPVNAQFGPFYRTDQVARLLGITRQAVADRIRKRSLLGMRTKEGTWVYPTFQFVDRGILSGLSDALRCFDFTVADGWAVAAWLTSPSAVLGGRRPLDRLRAGDGVADVLAVARDAMRRWRA
jgi:Antitoxin Xre/MbcA/ParS C-terminal toxin-binding domain